MDFRGKGLGFPFKGRVRANADAMDMTQCKAEPACCSAHSPTVSMSLPAISPGFEAETKIVDYLNLLIIVCGRLGKGRDLLYLDVE